MLMLIEQACSRTLEVPFQYTPATSLEVAARCRTTYSTSNSETTAFLTSNDKFSTTPRSQAEYKNCQNYSFRC